MLFSGKLSFRARVMMVIVAFAALALIFLSGIGAALYEFIHSLGLLGIVLMGAFYTFGLTTPTAFLILLKSMANGNYLLIALVASVTATFVDTILFILVKEQLEKGVAEIMREIRRRIGRHALMFPVMGFILFGSPLPDELALASMEISDIRPARIAAIIFSAKFLVLVLTFTAVQAA
ncbi:MAG: hypothetical protein KGH69_03325 [Candidatus Micrarchaeota archaeon]|nr:hypothetical protein [Candidatus Micrarchaeota archaeon]